MIRKEKSLFNAKNPNRKALLKAGLFLTALFSLSACAPRGAEGLYEGAQRSAIIAGSLSSLKSAKSGKAKPSPVPSEAPQKETSDSSSDALSKALNKYGAFLTDYLNNGKSGNKSSKKLRGSDGFRFTLVYIDADDIPELALADGEGVSDPVKLYYFDNGKVLSAGEYSMYGSMYYVPKKGYIVPMYFPPLANGEVLKYEKGKSRAYESWECIDEGKYFINDAPVSEEAFTAVVEQWSSKTLLSVFGKNEGSAKDLKNIDAALSRMASFAPVGISKAGVPIIDDSYLLNGKLSIKGKHAKELPGIWYLEDDEFNAPAWYEFDMNGTFTAHDTEGGVEACGYMEYRGKDPIFIDGSIYDMYLFDGTEYRSFEFAPKLEEEGYLMTFSGAIYYKP